MRRFPLRRRNAAGFSMIEVLIALVVLAFGLLGLALLQTMNLRYTKSANQRTQAVNLAGELFDMMRSNRSELSAYSMTKANFASVTVPPDAGCSNDALMGAAGNVTRWQCEVKETLGNDAWATVGITAATSQVTVMITWDESTLGVASGESNINLTSQL